MKIDLRKTRGETNSPPGLSLPNGLDYATATKPPPSPSRQTGYAALTSAKRKTFLHLRRPESTRRRWRCSRGCNSKTRPCSSGLSTTRPHSPNSTSRRRDRRNGRRPRSTHRLRSHPADVAPNLHLALKGRSQQPIADHAAGRPAVDPEPLAEQPMRENLQREEFAVLRRGAGTARRPADRPDGADPPAVELAAGSVVPGFTVTGYQHSRPAGQGGGAGQQ